MDTSSSRRALLFVLLGSLVATGTPARATQAPSPPPAPEIRPEQPFHMTARVELVSFDITMTDARGNFVRDAKRENFRILDDGVEQPITHFASVEAPALVLVLVETGPAVYLIHRQHLEAAYALLDGLAPDDRVALGTYDDSARLAMNFTEDKRALGQALRHLRYNLGMAQLNFCNSLSAALDWLAPIPGKKAVLLLSTGLDSSRCGGWESLARKLHSSDAMIFSIGLGGDLRETKRKRKVEPADNDGVLSFETANRLLESVAQLTGGRAYFPRNAGDSQGIYRQIAAAVRHQYSLGFAPPERDARFHTIEVQYFDERGRILASSAGTGAYHIAARPGYLAPAP